jgi:glycosyltransferase involved in cell wall biosynthesis
MNERRIVALLGRRDEPTDAVEEYCRYLGGALRAHGMETELTRVPWAERGWPAALREVRQKADAWRGRWALLQYTALAWSARGFPLRFLRIVKVLREAGSRVAVVYHDVEPYAGGRIIDKVRRRVQLHTMRQALLASDLAIFTVPPEKLSWKVDRHKNVVFIPVGANLPNVSESASKQSDSSDGALTVAVFGITGGAAGLQETSRIVDAVRFAARHVGKFHLVVLGRNSESAEMNLRQALRGTPVEARICGVLSAEEVVRVLSASDVLLFVRGPISSRRGSAIAGIACGLPVIAYAGSETAAPVTDAGVILVSQEVQAELGEALVRVLTDQNYRASMAERSRRAHAKYFGWKVIGARYAEALGRQRGEA